MAEPEPEQFVSTTQAGQMCGGFTSEWARQECEAGRFPGALRRPGGRWRIPLVSVQQRRADMERASQSVREAVVRRPGAPKTP